MPDAFEQAFSDLAYSFLQEKAVDLVKHLVGFEVVEKNDKGSKGLGIFAFKIGDEYFYAPVFFINGEIKPLELLYLKDDDLFVPLDEDWANYLMKKSPLILGEAVSEKRKSFDSPSLDLFAHPPITGKHVTASLRDLGKQTSRTLDYLDEAPNRVKEAYLKKLLSDRNYVQEAIEAFGFEPLKASLQFHKEAAEQVQEVEVITPDMPSAIRGLSKDQKKKVYTNKVVVKDSRPQEKITKLYDIQYTDKLQNPQVSGIYKLLDEYGNLVEALVLLTPQGRELYGCSRATVIEVETGRFVTAPTSKIWVKDNLVIDDWEGLFQKMKVVPRDAGKIGEVYVFINRNRDGAPSSSPPFCIKKVIRDSDGILNYEIQWCDSDHLGSYYKKDVKQHRPRQHGFGTGSNPAEPPSESNTYWKGWEHMSSQTNASLGHHGGGRMIACLSPTKEVSDGDLYVLSDQLIVPASFSLLPLEKPEYGSHKFELGTPGAVAYHLLHNRMNKLRVRSDGSEYFVSYNSKQEPPMKKAAAVRVMVKKFGLAGDDALGLLDHADNQVNRPVTVLAKEAAIGGVSGLEIPDPVITSDSGFVPKGKQLFNEELIVNKGNYPEIPELGKDENLYTSPDGAPPELDMSAAMAAAQGGQQQVFDHASLASLVRLSDTAEAINKYLPDLEKALDRVGRLLFLFWWNHDEFSELFGITKMNELEDLFRSVFKSFGELILELKKKERARLPMG